MSSPIVVFYRDKLINIFSSFFIKYFYKYTEENKCNFNSDMFKKYLLSFNKNSNEIKKSFSLFENYIDKKYDLDYTTLNTSLYIFIKESINDILLTKIIYTKKDELNDFYDKCCKKIAGDLYENIYISISEYKKLIQTDIFHMLNELLPINFITEKYNEIQKINDKKQIDRQHKESHSSENSTIKIKNSSINIDMSCSKNSSMSNNVQPQSIHDDIKSGSKNSSVSNNTRPPSIHDNIKSGSKNSSVSENTRSDTRSKKNLSSNIEYSDVMYDQYYSSDSDDGKHDKNKFDSSIKIIKLDNPMKK